MILIIKHIDIEGPGTLGDFLDAKKVPYKIIDLGSGEALPEEFSLIQGVVVLGGPMNVDEENKYSFLKPENEFIKEVIRRQIPYLGICLGAQLLAKAAGTQVIKSPAKEIGWYHIQLTDDGKKDPLFKGFRPEQPVYHWHGDMFLIPPRAKLLAVALDCPHQALKVGPSAYGLQFHVEVTDKSIKEWCEEYGEQAESMMSDYWRYQKKFLAQADRLYENFLEIIKQSSNRSTHV